MSIEVTDYGFKYGSMEVVRITQVRGTSVIEVRTPKQTIAIYTTKTGQLRIRHMVKVKR